MAVIVVDIYYLNYILCFVFLSYQNNFEYLLNVSRIS